MTNKLDKVLDKLKEISFLNGDLVNAAQSRHKVQKLLTELAIQYELELLALTIDCEEE